MGGASSRFLKAGIETPKYLLDARGTNVFSWAISSLPLHLVDRLCLVGLEEHRQKFDVETFVLRHIPASVRPCFIALDKVTRGQAESALFAEDEIPRDSQLLIYNIDTWFRSATLDLRLVGLAERGDGILGFGRLPGDNWSFARTDVEGRVVETSEKRRISENALTGLYHFSRAGDFFDAARDGIARAELTNGEFYVAPLYNKLIEDGKRFVLDEATLFAPIGTPGELNAFNHSDQPMLFHRH